MVEIGNRFTWLKVWDEAPAWAADPEAPKPPPPYGLNPPPCVDDRLCNHARLSIDLSLTWLNVCDEAAALDAEPENPPPNPPGCPKPPPPWLKVWADAPALAAEPPNPPPNCGAAKAAAMIAKRTMKNFMIENFGVKSQTNLTPEVVSPFIQSRFCAILRHHEKVRSSLEWHYQIAREVRC